MINLPLSLLLARLGRPRDVVAPRGAIVPQRRVLLLALLSGVFLLGAEISPAQDPGLDKIGKVRTELIFATNQGVADLGAGVKPLSKAEQKRLRASKIGAYSNFVKLGSVEQDVLAGYKSWAAPIANNEAILVTFQPQARINKKLRLDIELWQKKKMVLRWDPFFEVGKKIYLKGPKWRDGNLIITVELVSLKESKK